MSSIFLSFAVEDQQFAYQLATDLESQGSYVWKDCINGSPDKPFLDRLLSVPGRVNFLVLIFSQASEPGTVAFSDWDDAIIDDTIHGRDWLVPVWVGGSEPPLEIGRSRTQDFRDPSRYIEAFHELKSKLASFHP